MRDHPSQLGDGISQTVSSAGVNAQRAKPEPPSSQRNITGQVLAVPRTDPPERCRARTKRSGSKLAYSTSAGLARSRRG